MRALDPTTLLAQAAHAHFFFQFGKQDRFITEAQANELSDAAAGPKQIAWYDAHHDMNAAASTEHLAWLSTQLAPTPGMPTTGGPGEGFWPLLALIAAIAIMLAGSRLRHTTH